MERSLYHGTTFHRVCQILADKQLKGKEREEQKLPYVSLTEDKSIGLWFGDVVLEFPRLTENAIKIEYGNKEWKEENPDLCDYILEGVDIEEHDITGIEGMAEEKEYVIPDVLPFNEQDVIIHLLNEEQDINAEYEEHLRKVFGHDLMILVGDREKFRSVDNGVAC